MHERLEESTVTGHLRVPLDPGDGEAWAQRLSLVTQQGFSSVLLAFKRRPRQGWGWVLFDGVLSIAIALMIALGSWRLLKEPFDVLMEAMRASLEVKDYAGAARASRAIDACRRRSLARMSDRQIGRAHV